MSTSDRLAIPITATNSPKETTFGKPVHAKSNQTHDQEVVAIKFVPMSTYDADRASHTSRQDLQPDSSHKSNGQLSVQINSERGNSRTPLTLPNAKSPWWKSSIIKLIGTFVVAIVFLSLVAAAVMIRSDSSRSPQSSASVTSPSVTSTNPVSKRSTSKGNEPSGVSDNEAVPKSIERASNENLKVPVPIRVIIDPQLIAPQVTRSVQSEVLSSTNLSEEQSLDVAEGTRQLRQVIQQEKPFGDSSSRYVVEMDIKVKKSQ